MSVSVVRVYTRYHEHIVYRIMRAKYHVNVQAYHTYIYIALTQYDLYIRRLYIPDQSLIYYMMLLVLLLIRITGIVFSMHMVAPSHPSYAPTIPHITPRQ